MTDRELMQQALEALEVMRPACFAETTLKAADTSIVALRDRLAQPERKWVGLTDDDYETLSQYAFVEVIEKVEALLKEKNGG